MLIEQTKKELQEKLKAPENYLPDSLKNIDTWIKIIPSLLYPWNSANQALVMGKLTEFVEEKNSATYEKEDRMAFQFSSGIKSPISICDKVLRWLEELEELKKEDENSKKDIPTAISERKEDLKNMQDKEFLNLMLCNMEDVARGRILCNYSSDLDNLKEKIVAEFIPEIKEKILFKGFPDELNPYVKIKDNRIEGEKRFAKGGHRAIHLYFMVKIAEAEFNPLVEIQLMTFLQNAWDMKQHPLYEIKRRTTNHKQDNSELEILLDKFHAFSGLLLIADEFIDSEWKKFKIK